jgi:PAP2 superfamily
MSFQALLRSFVALVAAAGAAGASADVVTDWNATAFDVMRASSVTGAPSARTLAIMHVSMADAVNTVQNRYTRYAYKGKVLSGASPEAAAASAARGALLALYPAQQKMIDDAFAASVRSIADSPAKQAGVALGAEAAAAVVAERADDNTSVPDTYRPLTTPGVWVPTTPPITAQYARAKPWGFDRADKFRPGPPPALTSAEYARDYNETKSLGGTRSTQRTPEQSETVKFWSQPNLGLAWHQSARQLAAARKLDLADCARLFALLSMGQANTFIVDWDAKFHYNFWRPVTAIRNADMDGNDATERDAGWQPANATPMHPEYPSQAAIVAGVASAVLVGVLREPAPGPLTVTDSANAKLTRAFANTAALAEEQRMVRIWGGIHFRSSLDASERMGRALVAHLLETAYRPQH